MALKLYEHVMSIKICITSAMTRRLTVKPSGFILSEHYSTCARRYTWDVQKVTSPCVDLQYASFFGRGLFTLLLKGQFSYSQDVLA